MSYEAGYLLEDRLIKLSKPDVRTPLLKFFLYKEENVENFQSGNISFCRLAKDISQADYSLSNISVNTRQEVFNRSIQSIKKYIEEGDTYQVNYTLKTRFKFDGSLEELLLSLIFNQSAAYTAFINDGENFIISVSPELFFRLDGNKLTCRPMKGTAARGYSLEKDKENDARLKISRKDSAENLMIVDLLRNDMGKISEFGTVRVEKLFEIEKYESLFQMTSTITSELNQGVSFSRIIKNLFPCGSITGAPKIRTMEIIKELETEERGIYTGAIGMLLKHKAVFNVPIRTIVLSAGNGRGQMGIGSGIVWDSGSEAEYAETMLKSNFLFKPEAPFKIFSTMLAENKKVFLLESHIERLRETAGYFLFEFDEALLKSKIERTLRKLDNSSHKLKATIDKWGNIKIETSGFSCDNSPVDILVSEERISSVNKFQYFKTTNRPFYDRHYAGAIGRGFADVIFLNEKGLVAEGAISNIFIRKDNLWFTPPVSEGLLKGVYRSYFLSENKNCIEAQLTLDDLKGADEIRLTNALRKEIRVKNICYE